MGNKKLLIWDIDGTLLWTKGAGRKALNLTFEESYHVKNAFEGISLDGKLDGNVLEEVFRKHRITYDKNIFDQEYAKMLRFIYQSGIEWGHIPGIPKILTLLNHDKNVINTIGTGNLYVGARVKLEHAGLLSFFHEGAYGDEGGSRTELVQRAMKKYESEDIDEVYVIGDTQDDLTAAYENNTKAIGVVPKDKQHKITKSYNYPIIEDFLDEEYILRLLNLKR